MAVGGCGNTPLDRQAERGGIPVPVVKRIYDFYDSGVEWERNSVYKGKHGDCVEWIHAIIIINSNELECVEKPMDWGIYR